MRVSEINRQGEKIHSYKASEKSKVQRDRGARDIEIQRGKAKPPGICSRAAYHKPDNYTLGLERILSCLDGARSPQNREINTQNDEVNKPLIFLPWIDNIPISFNL